MTDSKPDDKDHTSIELLEKAIQDNSPEFLQELEAISEIGNENLDIELVDIDLIMEQQKANSLKARAKRLLSHLNQLAIKIFYFVKSSLITFAKETGPHYLKKLLALLKSGGQSLGHRLAEIRTFSKAQKAVLVLIIAGVVGLGFTVFKIATSGLIKDDEQLFVHSMEELSAQKFIYDTGDVEDFYNSSRVSQNIMSLRRIVVNIQRSKNSGTNPMVAIELYIQGNSSDVMVEMTDREAELLDRIQGQIRSFSYDEIDTVEGKRRMLDKIIRELNEDLTKGKITQIYFKNFVLKK
jgi:flagellar basal body-associated protein FliL